MSCTDILLAIVTDHRNLVLGIIVALAVYGALALLRSVYVHTLSIWRARDRRRRPSLGALRCVHGVPMLVRCEYCERAPLEGELDGSEDTLPDVAKRYAEDLEAAHAAFDRAEDELAAMRERRSRHPWTT